MVKFFIDTYGIIEISKGNPQYSQYINAELVTTLMNLYEVYYHALKDFGEKKALEEFEKFREIIIPIEEEYVIMAAKFRLKNKPKNLSYIDALGYIIAKEINAKFLTGDKEFQDIENVEFVK